MSDPERPSPPRRPGRPRRHADAAARVKAFRERQRQQARSRLDGFISLEAHSRIALLARRWGLTVPEAIERLILETADAKLQELRGAPA